MKMTVNNTHVVTVVYNRPSSNGQFMRVIPFASYVKALREVTRLSSLKTVSSITIRYSWGTSNSIKFSGR